MRTAKKEKEKNQGKKPYCCMYQRKEKLGILFAVRVKKVILCKDWLFSNEIAQFKKEGTTTNYPPLMKGNMQEANNSDL